MILLNDMSSDNVKGLSRDETKSGRTRKTDTRGLAWFHPEIKGIPVTRATIWSVMRKLVHLQMITRETRTEILVSWMGTKNALICLLRAEKQRIVKSKVTTDISRVINKYKKSNNKFPPTLELLLLLKFKMKAVNSSNPRSEPWETRNVDKRTRWGNPVIAKNWLWLIGMRLKRSRGGWRREEASKESLEYRFGSTRDNPATNSNHSVHLLPPPSIQEFAQTQRS